MHKIFIIGSSGCGKTTLARGLSNKLKIPYHDLDEYYWLPGWQPRTAEDFKESITMILEQPSWIVSGNYRQVRDLILAKTQILIWLDYSFTRCFYQALKRSIIRIVKQQSCCNGNQETLFKNLLSKHSVLWWIIKSYPIYKKEYSRLFKYRKSNAKNYLRFSSPSATEKWLTKSDLFREL